MVEDRGLADDEGSVADVEEEDNEGSAQEDEGPVVDDETFMEDGSPGEEDGD